MPNKPRVAVIVAHPDDESLWCGGLILRHPEFDWSVLTLCRGSDRERAVRFERAVRYLGARGEMADLDDGPAQQPLAPQLVINTISGRLPRDDFELVVTHGPRGEYTRHRRHEECCRAVAALWTERPLWTNAVKLFAYEDLGGSVHPRPRADADELYTLDAVIFAQKYHVITQLYGFDVDSWEAKTTPVTEAFQRLATPSQLNELIRRDAPPGAGS